MLTVWGRVNSINVQKVLWALAETGVPYTRIDAGMKFGVNNTPQYLAMNPNGLVPVIDDDGLLLWESNVIVRYLAEKYSAGKLWPKDLGERYHAESWMDWQQAQVYPPLGVCFIQLIRTPPEKRDAAALEQARPMVEQRLGVLEKHLAGRDFVGGRDFTMGDIPVGASVNRWYLLPIERESHPAVEAYLARLKERPGFQAHLALPLS